MADIENDRYGAQLRSFVVVCSDFFFSSVYCFTFAFALIMPDYALLGFCAMKSEQCGPRNSRRDENGPFRVKDCSAAQRGKFVFSYSS